MGGKPVDLFLFVVKYNKMLKYLNKFWASTLGTIKSQTGLPYKQPQGLRRLGKNI
jgi:hypothetical protein